MFGQTTANYDTGQSFVLADFDGDSKMEIILNLGWTVVVIDGDGRHLTSTYYPNSDRPVYLTDGTLSNTPAVGDIDHDGKLELITHNSILYVWDLPNASDKAEWPMFKFNAAGTASPITPASLDSSHDALLLFHQTGVPGPIRATIQVQNMGGQPMNWTITPGRDNHLPQLRHTRQRQRHRPGNHRHHQPAPRLQQPGDHPRSRLQ